MGSFVEERCQHDSADDPFGFPAFLGFSACPFSMGASPAEGLTELTCSLVLLSLAGLYSDVGALPLCLLGIWVCVSSLIMQTWFQLYTSKHLITTPHRIRCLWHKHSWMQVSLEMDEESEDEVEGLAEMFDPDRKGHTTLRFQLLRELWASAR